MIRLIIFYVVGVVFVICSLCLNYRRGKRQFNRHNAAGIETFNSYGKSLLSGGMDNLVRFIAGLLMIFGVIILLAAFFDADDIKQMSHW